MFECGDGSSPYGMDEIEGIEWGYYVEGIGQ